MIVDFDYILKFVQKFNMSFVMVLLDDHFQDIRCNGVMMKW